MALFWITLVVAALSAAATEHDSCPAPEELLPCTCDGEGMNCMGDRTVDEIKKAFRAKFKYGGVRSIWVQGTPLTDIPADIFGGVSSLNFYVEVNNIVTVDLRAFNSSEKILQILSFFQNKIKDFPYKELSKFKMLSTLNLGRNLIETIPDGAFKSKNLITLFLNENRISNIGANAFSGLPNLYRLEMTANYMSTLGPMSFAFKTHRNYLQINLAANNISEVSPTAFKGTTPNAIHLIQNQLKSLKYEAFADLIKRVSQYGGYIDVTSNPFSCKGCDYSWIVTNKEGLYHSFVGFQCQDGKDILDLTKKNIGCN